MICNYTKGCQTAVFTVINQKDNLSEPIVSIYSYENGTITNISSQNNVCNPTGLDIQCITLA